ncbi:MAG: sugar phosphate isomerase/epimerase, partial [Pedobacter sp.]
MKVKFGASILSWIPPVWTPEAGEYAIGKTASAGFDIVELLLPNNMEFDEKAVKSQLKSAGIGAVCALILRKEQHIPQYPKEALGLIKQALDKTAALDTDFLGGVLHSGIGCFTGNPVTEEEKATIVDVLGAAADYASRLGITIGIEPINRYE